MLAFPLFVVVVAVDARWVSKSLIDQYESLLEYSGLGGSNGVTMTGVGATTHDYLEKIFQIPFWLRPLSSDSCRRMIQGLLEYIAEEPLARSKANADAEGVVDDPDEQHPLEEAGGTDEGNEASGGREERERQTERLTITAPESRFMEELSPLLGRSPRVVKRFVNLYQLIKARLDSATWALFFGNEGEIAPYQMVMFLLSIVTAMPSFSTRFFAKLQELQNDDNVNVKTLSSLMEVLSNSQSEMESPECDRLNSWLENMKNGEYREWCDLDKSRLI